MKKLTTKIDPDRKNVLWYGGEVWQMEIGKYLVSCEAAGDVNATLYDENGNVIERVKDKKCRGLFRKKMAPYIKNDDALVDLIESDRLHLTSANWLECFFIDMETRKQSILTTCVDDTEDVELSFLEADEKDFADELTKAFGLKEVDDPVLRMLLKETEGGKNNE